MWLPHLLYMIHVPIISQNNRGYISHVCVWLLPLLTLKFLKYVVHSSFYRFADKSGIMTSMTPLACNNEIKLIWFWQRFGSNVMHHPALSISITHTKGNIFWTIPWKDKRIYVRCDCLAWKNSRFELLGILFSVWCHCWNWICKMDRMGLVWINSLYNFDQCLLKNIVTINHVGVGALGPLSM